MLFVILNTPFVSGTTKLRTIVLCLNGKKKGQQNMEEFAKLISNYGTGIVMLAYFIVRDIKFMTKLDNTLDVIKELLRKDSEKE